MQNPHERIDHVGVTLICVSLPGQVLCNLISAIDSRVELEKNVLRHRGTFVDKLISQFEMRTHRCSSPFGHWHAGSDPDPTENTIRGWLIRSMKLANLWTEVFHLF